MSEAILKGDLLTWPRACRPLALVAALGVAISCLLLSGCALFGIPEEGGHEPELFRNAAFSGPEAAWLVTESGGLLQTLDGGASWHYQRPELVGGFERISFVSDSDGRALSRHGEIWRTTDGGASWAMIAPKDMLTGTGAAPELIQQIQFVDPEHGWVFDPLNVLATSDGGYKWNHSSLTVKVNGRMTAVHHGSFPSFQDGWLAGQNGSLHRTTDGGLTWGAAFLDEGHDDVSAVFFVNPTVGWASELSSGAIYQTTNGGDAWTQQQGAIPGTSIRSIYFLDEKEGWAVGGQEANQAIIPPRKLSATILHTQDGGRTWEVSSRDGNQVLFKDVYFGNKDHGWLLGSDIPREHHTIPGDVLFRTTDRGRSWAPLLDYEKVRSLCSGADR